MDDNEKLERRRPHSLAPAIPQVYRDPEIVDVSPEEVPHLLDYWQIVVKRRWTVVACLVIVFTTVAIGTLKQNPIYEGKVLLEIDPEEPAVLTFREVQSSGAVGDVDSYRETQYKILQSRSLAETVVKDLQLYRYPEFYRSRFLFGLFESNPDKIPSASDAGPPDPSMEAYRNSVALFVRGLDVNPVRRSNLVEVTFDSQSPELAMRIANRLAEAYIKQNLQVRWDEAEAASKWLQEKLVDLKAKLEKAEDNLQAYAQANSIIFINEKQSTENARLEQLIGEYTRTQADRYQRESLYSQLEAGKVQDLPAVLNNNMVQQLELRMADLEREYVQTTAWVKPDYPKAVALQKQIAKLQALIDRQKKTVAKNIADDYHAAVQREKYLEEAVADQKKVVQDLAERGVQYNILKRQVDSYSQLYSGLLQRMKEAQISSTSTASNVRVVDNAELPKGPVKPRVLLNLAAGLILGLALGVGLAFFQEYLDKTLKTPEEVERLLRLPSLGVLPKFALNGHDRGDHEEKLVPAGSSGDGAVAPAIQTDATSVEAFRSLRTSILLSASPVPKLLLITSALPGEGKTTTTVNLGATLASLGSRVLIVDGDLRKPMCHRSTGVKNAPGFVQCLTGRTDLRNAILSVPAVANLSIIPCGPIPPNPAEVLSSPLANELLRKLRADFDYVLVDSPPVLAVADTRILATLTDAAVLVTRAFETPYDIVRRARSLLYGAGARILGVALNDVDFRRDGYGTLSYYRYGYGREDNSNEDRESPVDDAAHDESNRAT